MEKMLISTKNTIWNIETGEISTNYKVYGKRYNAKDIINFRFSAGSILGNTNASLINLYQCEVEMVNLAITYSDNCILDLYVSDRRFNLLDKIESPTNLLYNNKMEKVKFTTINNRVKSIINLSH